MGLNDSPQLTISEAVNSIRRTTVTTHQLLIRNLGAINQMLNTFGVEQVRSALGEDADAFVELYDAVRQAVSLVDPEISFPDIPPAE